MRLLLARKRQIELLVAVGTMVAAAYTSPLIAYGLIILTFGLLLDVATSAWAGASSTGSMRDYRQ